MRRWLVIYDFALDPSEFPNIRGKIFIFFFINVQYNIVHTVFIAVGNVYCSYVFYVTNTYILSLKLYTILVRKVQNNINPDPIHPCD